MKLLTKGNMWRLLLLICLGTFGCFLVGLFISSDKVNIPINSPPEKILLMTRSTFRFPVEGKTVVLTRDWDWTIAKVVKKNGNVWEIIQCVVTDGEDCFEQRDWIYIKDYVWFPLEKEGLWLHLYWDLE